MVRVLLIAAMAVGGCARGIPAAPVVSARAVAASTPAAPKSMTAAPVVSATAESLPIRTRNVFLLRLLMDLGITKEQIHQTIKASSRRIASCYEVVLLSTPGLAGTVRTNFQIERDGTVSRATAAGVHPAVEECIAGVLRSLRFPASINRAVVNYPFGFRPAGDGDGP
jgi:hypothetical protein